MGLARRQQNSANHSLHLHDAAVVVLLLIGAGAGVAPLLGLLGERVVHVDDGDVLGPQPLVLLPQVGVPRLHRLEPRDGGTSLLLPLRLGK